MLSFPQLFGDLGGLYVFLATMVLYVIGRYQTGAFGLHEVKLLFRLPLSRNRKHKLYHANNSGFPDLSMREKLFEPIKQGICE